MANTMNDISSAMANITTMKQNLRKAFEDLQPDPSSLSSFTLQWNTIEHHFNSFEQSIKSKSKNQITAVQTPANEETKTPAKLAGDIKIPAKIKPAEVEELPPRPELLSLCTNPNPQGLVSFVIKNKHGAAVVRLELPPALRSAPDPATLVLDCLNGFYPSKAMRPLDLNSIRWACVVLLERLAVLSPEIRNPSRDRAVKIANDWKPKVSLEGDTPMEAHAFLQLLVTFEITSLFEEDELCNFMLSIGRRKQGPDLCRALGLAHRMSDFIQRLINKGKQIEAMNFIYHFELVDKFPPVPLLKSYLKETEKTAQEILKKGKNSDASQNEAANKELTALREIIKVIDEHKLESQYSRENHDKRIEQLVKERADRKCGHVGTYAYPKQQQQQPANKRPRPAPRSEINPAALAAPQARPVGSFGPPGGLFADRAPPSEINPAALAAPQARLVGSFGPPGGLFAGRAPPSEISPAALAAPQARPVGSFGPPGGLFADRAPPSEVNPAALAAPQARPVGSFGSPGGLFADRAPPSMINPAALAAPQPTPVGSFGPLGGLFAGRAPPQPYHSSGGTYSLSGLGATYNGVGSRYGVGPGPSLLNLSGNQSPPHLSGSHLYSSVPLGGGGGGGIYNKPLGYNSSYPLSGQPPSYYPSYYP